MAATNVTKWVAAGARALQWSKLTTGGYLAGWEGKTAADTGDSSSMARHRGLQNFPWSLPEPTELNVPGDDGTRAVFLFDSDARPSFIMELADFDGDFYEAVTGLTRVTIGEWEEYPIAFEGMELDPVCLMSSAQTKAQNAGKVGQKGYVHDILMNCECFPLFNPNQTKQHSPVRYKVTCNSADVLPDGRTVSSVYTTAPNGVLGGIRVTTAELYSYSILVGDGAEDTITTANDPISATKAKATVETTGFALGTVSSVTTNGLVLSAAPGSGKFAIGRYGFLTFA